MKIKICGMKYADNLQAIAALQPDYLGYIFYPPSRRYMGEVLPAGLLPAAVGRVGVFVDAAPADIVRLHASYRFDLVQLHGHETAADCRWLHEQGIACMKAFAPAPGFRFGHTEAYEPWCRYFLFDSPTPAYGGSGLSFDWSVIGEYRGQTPFFLSGGLGPDNVGAALRLGHDRLAGLDFNSRLESQPGLKVVETTYQIIQTIRQYANIQS